jgi:hypothetical protein
MFNSRYLHPRMEKVILSVGPVALLFLVGWLFGIAGVLVYGVSR